MALRWDPYIHTHMRLSGLLWASLGLFGRTFEAPIYIHTYLHTYIHTCVCTSWVCLGCKVPQQVQILNQQHCVYYVWLPNPGGALAKASERHVSKHTYTHKARPPADRRDVGEHATVVMKANKQAPPQRRCLRENLGIRRRVDVCLRVPRSPILFLPIGRSLRVLFWGRWHHL